MATLRTRESKWWICSLLVTVFAGTLSDSAHSGEDLCDESPGGRVCGTRSGGGGDVDAVEFINYGYDFLSEVKKGTAPSSVDPSAIEGKLKILLSSLNDPVRAKVQFTTDTVLDFNLVEKQAVFNRELETIIVHRPSWKIMSPAEKLTLATIEIAGLIGSPVRYSEALAMARSNHPDGEGFVKPAVICGQLVDLATSEKRSNRFAGEVNWDRPYLDARVLTKGGLVVTMCESNGFVALLVHKKIRGVHNVIFYPGQKFD